MNSQNKNSNSILRNWLFAPRIALGVISIVLGMAAIIGWHVGSLTLVQIRPSFVPMQYNTALGFLLCGIGLVASTLRFGRTAIAFGASASILGVLSLSQYLFGVNLGIDELLMEAYITVKSSHPGRMAPNTALCFALSGAAIALLRAPNRLFLSTLGSFMGGVVSVLGLVVLFGYIVDIPDLYQWQKLTHMAVHTSVGFISLGVGLMMFLWVVRDAGDEFTTLRVPILVALIGVTLSSCMLAALTGQEAQVTYETTATDTQYLGFSIKKQLGAEIQALERKANRWASEGAANRELWEVDSEQYVKDIDGLIAIEFVDPDFVVQRVVPLKGNEAALDLNLSFEERRKTALKSARDGRKSVVTSPIKLVQGGTGLHIYSPILVNDEFEGFILGVFRIKELFDSLLPEEFGKDYSVAFLDNGIEIFSTHDARSGIDKSVLAVNSVSATFDIFGSELDARVTPLPAKLSASNSYVKYLAFLVGLLVSALVAWVMYLAQKIRLRAAETAIANEQLSREVEQRKRIEEEMKAARDTAFDSVRLKSEFLANMSHEIRTPMNGIIGMLDLLVETDLNNEQLEFLQLSQLSADSLLNLIDDILDFSKIEAGHLEFTSVNFDLRDIVEGTVGTFVQQAEAKSIEITAFIDPDVPSAVKGDPQRLRQILNNLIGNAIKFTEVGEVFVGVSNDLEADDLTTLKFEIRDTGIGIPENAKGILFQAFMQADGSMTRKYGGTGLGLTITRQLVEMMNGEIDFESEQDKGSTFYFTAQFKKQNVEETIEIKPRKDLKGLRVLVVDDIQTNVTVLSHQLQAWGIDVEGAMDGSAAIRMLRDAEANGNRFELAILDLMMPGMDGFSLARNIKAEPLIAETRLILMPSFGQRGHNESSEKIGIGGYLVKPVSQSDLQSCISAVMGKTSPGRTASGQTPNRQVVTKHSIRESDKHKPATRILIAEDNVVNQQVAKLQLEKLGYETDIAVDGLEVLDLWSKQPYSMILMGCQMPRLNGYETTAEIRRNEAVGERIPIIAVTANAMKGERDKCLQCGMDDYLAKPFRRSGLQEIVESWLNPVFDKSKVKNELIEFGEVSAKSFNDNLLELESELGRGMLNTIIDLFVEDSELRLEQIVQGLKTGDLKLIATAAHSYKGSSLTVGAWDLGTLCRQLENAAKLEDVDEAQRQYEEVVKSTSAALNTLNDWHEALQ